MKKLRMTWVTVIFVVGMLLGTAGGALIVTWKVMRFEADAVTQIAANATSDVASLLIMLDEKDIEKRLQLFESSARSQVVVGILSLHYNLPLLTKERQRSVKSVLRSLATNREKLKIGGFADPPRTDFDNILNLYSTKPGS